MTALVGHSSLPHKFQVLLSESTHTETYAQYKDRLLEISQVSILKYLAIFILLEIEISNAHNDLKLI